MGVKAVAWVMSISALLAGCAACFISISLSCQEGCFLLTLTTSALAILCLVGMCLCWDIARLRPDDTHTLSSLLHMYYYIRFISPADERWALAEMERLAGDCMESQEELLRKMILSNRGTAYRQDYHLDDVKNLKDFVAQHPLTNYSHYESYCNRIAKGEHNVLTSDEVVFLALSSGTTGKTKRFPLTDDFHTLVKLFISHQNAFLSKKFGSSLQKKFLFRIFHPKKMSEGGVSMGGGYQFALRRNPGDGNVTPEEFLDIYNEGASFYVQAVFALADPEIRTMEGFSSDLMYSFFTFVKKHKQELCEDIEKGCIRLFPNLSPSIQHKLNKRLRANAGRASVLHDILNGPAEGMAHRIWPQLQFVMVAASGGFANSHRLLTKTFLKGLPSGFLLYGGSEGLYGLTHVSDSLNSAIYTLIPNSVIFEFIPLEETTKESPKTVFLDQVNVGQRYELVVSNTHGLLRQRFGDVVEIVGFYKTLPKIRFLYRTGQILTVAFDRTPESIIYEAVKRTEAKWQGLTVDNYTATESFHLEELLGEVYTPACYVLFMEITDGKKAGKLSESQFRVFEDVLCETHEAYHEFRDKGSLSPAKIIQVRCGTFQYLQDVMQTDRTNIQFKMPRVLRKESLLKLLLERRL